MVSDIWPGQDFSRSRSLRQGQIKVKLWRGTTTLPNQCSYQIWTSYTLRFPSYGPDKIFQGQGHYGKVTGQIKVKLWWGTTTHPNQCPYQIWTSYTLRFLRYGPDKIFKLKVTTARSKVKSRLNYDVAHLHPPTNVPTKYHHPTPYSYWDLARTRYLPPPARPPARPTARPPSRTPWVKTIPQSLLRLWGKIW